MADTGLTGPALDLAARHVIHAYLADLSGQLGGATAARTQSWPSSRTGSGRRPQPTRPEG
jgi:hypothetical protein